MSKHTPRRTGKVHYIDQKELAEENSQVCCNCDLTLPLSDFHKNKSRSNGHSHRCKKCTKIYQQEKDEHLKAYRKVYHQKNREKHVEYNRNYYHEHKDDPEFKARQKKAYKKYYEANKEKINAKHREYYHMNKAKPKTLPPT